MKKMWFVWCACLSTSVFAQSLPEQWVLDGHQLKIGGVEDNGLYDKTVIRDLYLDFASSNFWTQMTANYGTENEVQATLTVDGVSYPSVGVSFKGQTSYQMSGNSEKKSFSIKMDSFVPGQSLMGYSTLNLNNSFDDNSMMREFLYLHFISRHIPAAKCNYVRLYLNDEYWGIYPNVEQLNNDMMEEWFLSNNGTRWRADAPSGTTGGGPGGGPQWGDGTAALNYNGSAQSDYDEYYTLKSTSVNNPWDVLIETCDVLNNTALANLPLQLPAVMDVDRALWFLACEIAFSDDDSYVYKGKMDYYLYWENETGRITPLEFDGNSILGQQAITWGPFYHADNVNYPLLNRLMQVPEYRQRYLAHLLTIIAEMLDPAITSEFISTWSTVLGPEVQNDPKIDFTYNQFTSELTVLQTRLNARRTTLNSNTEVNTTGAVIADVETHSEAGTWADITSSEAAEITATVSSKEGVATVYLHYSNQLVGNFTRVEMTAAGANAYTAFIPAMAAGTVVRFYLEAVEANAAGTRTYAPVGAEHDVYYYHVLPMWAVASDVVINELQAANSQTQADEAGEFDDWIELYNKGTQAVDLTGYYITDNEWNLTKWEIPDGTLLQPDAYLIIWADEDSIQGTYHANFKLSATAESLTLLNGEGLIADQVDFSNLESDQAFARNPNGTGSFVIQAPTFAFNNEEVSVQEKAELSNVFIYPNPTQGELFLSTQEAEQAHVTVYDLRGAAVHSEWMFGSGVHQMDLNALAPGMYILQWISPTQQTHQSIVVR